MNDLMERYGPWALIAGGAQGIGEAFARYLAAQGFSLIILDRENEPLTSLCAELEQAHGIACKGVTVDLASDAMLATVVDAVGDREVGLLIYNAAIADVGPFYKADTGLELERQKIAVNVSGPLLLTYHFAAPMLARQRGGIILMSSGAGLQGAPYYAHYSATKAYSTTLAEALHTEFKPYNVDVMACVAGMTLSTAAEGYKHLDTSDFQTVEDLANEAMAAIGSGPTLIAGKANREGREFLSQLPKSQQIAAVAQHAIDSFLDGKVPPQNIPSQAQPPKITDA